MRYDYNLPWRGAVLGALFYAGLSVLTVRQARDVPGIIFAVLMGLTAIFVALGIFMIVRRLAFPCVLELTEDAILFPHGFPRTRITRVLYVDIIRMGEWALTNTRGFYMVTGRGRFEIMAGRFPEMANYKAVREFICSKTSIAMNQVGKAEPMDWRWRGFPEPVLRWLEPPEWARFRTQLFVSEPLLPRLFRALWFFVRCLGVMLLPWLLLRLFQIPTAGVAGFLGLAISASLFFTLLYWLYAKYPVHAAEISFREKGVTKFFGKQMWDFNYGDFSGWALVEQRFEDRSLHILLMKCRSRVIEFALPDATTRDRVSRLLHEKGIPPSSDLRPSWERSTA